MNTDSFDKIIRQTIYPQDEESYQAVKRWFNSKFENVTTEAMKKVHEELNRDHRRQHAGRDQEADHLLQPEQDMECHTQGSACTGLCHTDR